MIDEIKRALALNMESNGMNILNSTNSNNNNSHDGKLNERLDKPFIGSDTFQNATFCGYPIAIPDWNSVGFMNRPNTYDCVRLAGMWFHRPGYFQLSKFGGVSETDWSFLTLFNSCEMDVRRLDFDNQWGARVGSFDIMLSVGAGILVSVGSEYKNPEVIKYMAAISGSCGCQEIGPNPIALLEFGLNRNENSPKPTGSQATQMPTWLPLPSAMSSSLTRPTPTSFPVVAQAGATTVTAASYVSSTAATY